MKFLINLLQWVAYACHTQGKTMKSGSLLSISSLERTRHFPFYKNTWFIYGNKTIHIIIQFFTLIRSWKHQCYLLIFTLPSFNTVKSFKGNVLGKISLKHHYEEHNCINRIYIQWTHEYWNPHITFDLAAQILNPLESSTEVLFSVSLLSTFPLTTHRYCFLNHMQSKASPFSSFNCCFYQKEMRALKKKNLTFYFFYLTFLPLLVHSV